MRTGAAGQANKKSRREERDIEIRKDALDMNPRFWLEAPA